jgi:Phage integrase family.
MEFHKSTCDFILRETTTTKTKKRGKKKEEKPLFIYLQVRTTWNDKQIFKSTGVKILPSLWSTRNQRPLFAEFEEHTAGYMELKELAQRLQSAKEQCEDITNRLNQAKLTKEEANALLQNLAKLQTAPKQDTTDETIAPYKSTSTATDHHTDEDEEGQTLLQKFIAYGQTNIDIQNVLKVFSTLTSKKKPNSDKLNFSTQSPEQLEKAFIKYGVTSQRLEKLTKADIKRLEEEVKRTLLKRTANKYLSSFASAYYQITDKRITFKKEKVQSDEDTMKKPTLSLSELQSVTADWLKLPLPSKSIKMHACTGLFLIQCWTACRVSDVAKVMDAIKSNYDQIQADIKETGTGQITYTTRKTNETCFVPIFGQTLQVFDRLSKDKNLPLLLQRLRVEDKVTDYIKQHQQRRKTIQDIIKVMPAESMQSIIDEYRKTGNAAKLLKKARDFDYFQRNGYNRHIKTYFQDLVNRGVLEDEIISCWTSGGKDSGKNAMIWKECSKWQNISSHCARHTFASIAFAEFGYTAQQVQSVTGHKNIDMLFKHYIERQAQDKRKSIESKAAAALALEKLQQAI